MDTDVSYIHMESLQFSMQQLWQLPMCSSAIYITGRGTYDFGWDKVTKTDLPSYPKQPKDTQIIWNHSLKGIG